MNTSKIIIALDDESIISPLIERLDPRQCNIKVGLHLFTKFGPSIVRKLQRLNFKIFLDMKYHDIPKTVADAVEAAADLGVWMVNLHAIGGRRMMEAARQRLEDRGHYRNTKLIAVTVLTSLESDDIQEMTIMHTPSSLTDALTGLAAKCLMDGVVCSPHELELIRSRPDIHNNFLTVVPGIRFRNADLHDQKRVQDPIKAIDAGASYIVVGRAITEAEDPFATLNGLHDLLHIQDMDAAEEELD